MRYSDGKSVCIGDRVALGGGMYGVVVASIDDNAYSAGHSEQDWGYLERGVIIESKEAGIVHFRAEDPDLTLLKRDKS